MALLSEQNASFLVKLGAFSAYYIGRVHRTQEGPGANMSHEMIDEERREAEADRRGNAAVTLPPAAATSPDSESLDRRAVLQRIAAAIGAAIGLAVAVPLAGMLLTPLTRRGRRVAVRVGPVEAFGGGEPVLTTVTFRQRQAWLEHKVTQNIYVLGSDDGHPAVLSARCTHLGCQVRWESASGEFVCPCHGGRFDREGRRVAGPPPRPLPRLPTMVREGVLYVSLPAEV